MKRFLSSVLGLFLLVAVARAAGPSPSASTGDTKLDAFLQKMNTAAKVDPDGFFKDLSARHGIPEADIRQVQETQGLTGGDLFMATALAKATHRPVLAVAEDYRKNEGKGWGVMAKEMGIKPGSPAFHELKNGARGSVDHMDKMAKEKHKHEKQMKKESQGKGGGKGKGKEK